MAENFNDKIAYVFNVEEEITLNGIKKVLELRKTKLKTVEYSISLEPTDGKIIMGNKGLIVFEVLARGKTAHASQPDLGENAVYTISKAIPKIEEYNQGLKQVIHPVFGCASASLGIIEGGTASNVIPDLARMEIDRRILPNENSNVVEQEFRQMVAPLEVITKKKIDPAETSIDSKIIKEMQGVLTNLGMDSKTYGYTATSELSEISKYGIEGMVFGTAELGQAHKPDEYMTLEQLDRGTRILSELLKKWD
jgi:acetylornithine deacetylase/succinyl-diaminopimelate desuccinylase-like protein